mgnify:FL=1
MAEQEIFEIVLKQLASQTSDIEVNSVNITSILRIAMEIVESTKVKGAAQKALVEKVVRQIIVDAPISDEKEKLLLDLCDEGILGSTIDMVVAASKGELDLNTAAKVATGCCISFIKKTKK